MKRVILESPFAGEVERNKRYARLCMRDCIERNEAPFASHLLYTQVLDDSNPVERTKGLEAAWSWIGVADMMVVYQDFGITAGMKAAIDLAESDKMWVQYRELGKERLVKEGVI